VVLTTGGRLAEAAREAGVPVIGVPAGMEPRAAALYLMIGTLECAALCGAAPGLHSEIDTSAELLQALIAEWGPEASDASAAKDIASRLQGTVPVVHGADPTTAVARRWRTQLNENAKAAAFWSELPEANHNELCGWERGRRTAPLAAIFLCDPDQHPRIRRRFDLTRGEVERAGAPAIVAHSRGDSRLERVLSLLLLGDLMSVYLAVLEGVDPTPVEPLLRFKTALAGQR
jgi:glucose/mannose-6-phosphate isomerase